MIPADPTLAAQPVIAPDFGPVPVLPEPAPLPPASVGATPLPPNIPQTLAPITLPPIQPPPSVGPVGLPPVIAPQVSAGAIPPPPVNGSLPSLSAPELPPLLAPTEAPAPLPPALAALAAGPSVDPMVSAAAAQSAERLLSNVEAEQTSLEGDAFELAREGQSLQAQLAELQAERGALGKGDEARIAEIDAEASALQDQLAVNTERNAELRAQYGELASTADSAGQQREQARARAVEDITQAQRETELMAVGAALEAETLKQAEAEELQRAADAKLTEARTREAEARKTHTESRTAYDDLLKSGPAETSTGLVVASVIGELLMARTAGREPNIAGLFASLKQQTQQEFDGRVQRQAALLDSNASAVEEAAHEQAVIDAETASLKVAMYQRVDAQLQQRIRDNQGTLLEAQLVQVSDTLRSERDAAEQQAMAAAAKAERQRQEADIKYELDVAKLRKLGADASLAERKARGGGTGVAKPDAAGAGVRDPFAVYVPGTNTKVADFRNIDGLSDSQALKRASEANGVITGMHGFLQEINKYEAMLEDFGSRGVFDRPGFTASEEYTKMQAAQNQLEIAMAKIIAGRGLATTASDMEVARGLVGLPEGWWARTSAKVATESVRKNAEEKLRLELNPYLTPESQERFIMAARKRGVSKSDKRKSLVRQAPAILADPTRGDAERIEAIDLIEERARAQEKAGEWKPAEDDPKVRQWSGEGSGSWQHDALQQYQNVLNANNHEDPSKRTSVSPKLRKKLEKRIERLQKVIDAPAKAAISSTARKLEKRQRVQKGLPPNSYLRPGAGG